VLSWVWVYRALTCEPLAESGDPRGGRRLAPASIARRTSALHGFYRYATRQHAVVGSPFTDVERPRPGDEHATSRLSTAERRQLRAAARAAGPRSEALITLLLTNGLRISEALAARIDDLSITEGHRVLRYRRKGNKRTTAPLTASVLVALDACIGERTDGPIFATATGTALDRVAAWRLLRRLARQWGVPTILDSDSVLRGSVHARAAAEVQPAVQGRGRAKGAGDRQADRRGRP